MSGPDHANDDWWPHVAQARKEARESLADADRRGGRIEVKGDPGGERDTTEEDGMSDQVQPEQGNIIGEFTPFTYRITCEREPEVGIAWMACIKELGRCALGDTPKAAGEHLLKTLPVSGHGKLYEDNCKSLEEAPRES